MDVTENKTYRFRKYCCVSNCSTCSQTDTYHLFPKDSIIRKKWVDALNIKKNISNSMYVCSKHFQTTDYFPNLQGERRHLKKGIIPSLVGSTTQEEIPVLDTVVTKSLSDSIICINSSAEKNPQDETGPFEKDEICYKNLTAIYSKDNDNASGAVSTLAEDNVDNLISRSHYCDLICERDRMANKIKDQEIEIKKLKENNDEMNIILETLRRQHISHDLFKFDDKSIKYYTGFINYKCFTIVYNYLLPSNDIRDINSKSPLKFRKQCKLSAMDQFLLFLIKIRQNFDYKHLSFLFNISECTACRIFQNWLNLAYCRLGSLCIWPHRDVLLENAPSQFKEKYPSVIASIDCTEIYIEQPSSLVRQSQCYSNYKSRTTLKGLVAIDPRGAIIFISSLYTGSISDVKIFTESGFLKIVKEKLVSCEIKPTDIILADKGFNVGNLLEPVKLNLPPFKKTGTQFTECEVDETRKIASVRVHVERAIGRIKNFKILKDIPISMCGNINQIWTVCGLLTNFMLPLVYDKEINDVDFNETLCTVRLINE